MIRYAITDGLPPFAGHVAQHVDFVQLRNKTMPAGHLFACAHALLRELPVSTKLVINGRADVALAAGAAGVHLTSSPNELMPGQIRSLFAGRGWAEPTISISCHTLAEVERARLARVDLILFGPVFEKRGNGELVSEGVGLAALRQASTSAGQVPVLALGGVMQANISLCLEQGAAGVAGIRLFS